MKHLILALTVILGTSLAFAGAPKKHSRYGRKPANAFKASDFNKMIQESQQSEAELRQQLQKKAGIRLNQEKPGTIAREKLEIPTEPEQVVVNTSDSFWKMKSKGPKEKSTDKANMKRISQELIEASH